MDIQQLEIENYGDCIIYKPKNNKSCVAIDAKSSKQLEEYHRNSFVQININNNLIGLII